MLMCGMIDPWLIQMFTFVNKIFFVNMNNIISHLVEMCKWKNPGEEGE